MKIRHLDALIPGVFAAAMLVLAASAGAQPVPAPATSPAVESTPAPAMTGHHRMMAPEAGKDADMKAECQGMMARKKEMEEKTRAMDERLDELVAQMNAAQGSTERDAMEKPMAAVINELVAQHKAMRSMAMAMQPEMMRHMMHHMEMRGAKGAMDCPMMRDQGAPPAAAGEAKPPK